ncbi:MAG: sulfatase-like hydrolase/transferase [Verrucomicrobiales bacterium]
MRIVFLLLAVLVGLPGGLAAERPPNIVYIMSDELAYYELSHMGNAYIKTPRIDRMAAEGIRFTHAYAGSPVCAPLRCNLMTGKHAGHASVRANDGGTPLRAGEATIASALQAKGYATGGFGKWGCGGRDSTGVPEKHGFDVFFGYYDQVHAHSFYPPYLIRNSEEVALEGNVGGRSGKTYSHYRIMEEGLGFIRANKDKPFFCYLPITPPHGMYDIPQDDPAWDLYKGEDWIRDPSIARDIKNYAAMVSMVDHNVGQVLDLLRELGLEKDTIVFFTGDNGGQDRFRSKEKPRGFFGPNINPANGVEFRGGKGSLYEGGLRIPSIARWPGRIKAGQVSDLVFYQPDVFPTLAEVAGAKLPADLDGISFVPALLGREQKKHGFLYWEFGNQSAVRSGNWKAVLNHRNQSWELFDLDQDISEKKNLAGDNPEILGRLKSIAVREHTPVNPGTFTLRTRHERDRRAKWGDSKNQPVPRRGKVERIKAKNLIPPESMKILKVSSENRGNGKLAINAIDGDPHTLWHSRFSDRLEKHPHELVIDLGESYTISGFRYLARQDGGWNGAFADVEFYVSATAEGLGEAPVVKAKFGRVKAAQAANCSKPVVGRYVRVRALSEVSGQAFGSAAEIGVIGTHRR